MKTYKAQLLRGRIISGPHMGAENITAALLSGFAKAVEAAFMEAYGMGYEDAQHGLKAMELTAWNASATKAALRGES